MSHVGGALVGLALMQLACSEAGPTEAWHAELAGRRVRHSAVGPDGSVVLCGDRPELERVVGGTAWLAKVDAAGVLQWEVAVEDLRMITHGVVGADGIIRVIGAPEDRSGWAALYPTFAIAFDPDGNELYRVDGLDDPYDKAQHIFADGSMVKGQRLSFSRTSPEGDTQWKLYLGPGWGSYVDFAGRTFGVNGALSRPSEVDPSGWSDHRAVWYVDTLDWDITRVVVDDLTPWDTTLTAGSLAIAEHSIVAKRSQRREDGTREIHLVRFDPTGKLLRERRANLGGFDVSLLETNNASDIVVVANGGRWCCEDESWVGILDARGVWVESGVLPRIDEEPIRRWQGHSGVHTIDAHLLDDRLYLVGVQDAMFTWVRRFDL